MKNNHYFLFICLSGILLCGCKSWVGKKYEFNRPFNYAGKHDFLNKLHQRNIDSNFLFVTNHSSFTPLINWLGHNNPPIYIGTFINDSVMLKRSDFLKDNQSCMGRLEQEISQHLQLLQTNTPAALDTMTLFNNIRLYQLSSGKQRSSLYTGKPTVVMFYLDAIGTYYDDLFKDIRKVSQQFQGEVDFLFLCCDYQTLGWLPKQ